MKRKIVVDSSANMRALEDVDFVSVPLTIRTAEREFVDDSNLDVLEMAEYFSTYKGKSGTACPGVGDYLNAFEGADEVFCVTIISTLSGSYNAAMTAASQYMEENPGKKVYVMDSYSTGPEMKLIVEKIVEGIKADKDFETICKETNRYKENHTALLFCLENMRNLANNGRVKPAVAAIAGLLGIRAVGDVSVDGQIHPVEKCRGEKKAISSICSIMKNMGYHGGQVIVDHCNNFEAARALKAAILSEYKDAKVRIEMCMGLCSFYAEKGGLIIGFVRNK